MDSSWNPLKMIKRKKDPGLEIARRTLDEEFGGDSAEKKKAGWVSPNYTQSRTCSLNPFDAASNRCMAVLPNSPDVEAYKVLRTHILQKTEHEKGKAIMITSPLAGEGKTTTAINLAFTFAREFKQTVLLVDCDFRKQRIHELLGINSDKGVIDYLLNNTPVSDLIIWPGVEKLTLISGGRTVHDSTELLRSPRMKELVQDMQTRYEERYVFFDVPAILTSADALAFAPLVDYVLMVVSAGSTSVSDVRKALQMIPSQKMLGLVLNKYGTN